MLKKLAVIGGVLAVLEIGWELGKGWALGHLINFETDPEDVLSDMTKTQGIKPKLIVLGSRINDKYVESKSKS